MNADALSWAKHPDEPTAEENKEHQEDNEVGEMKIHLHLNYNETQRR